MKIYGTLKEVVAAWFRKDGTNVILRPNNSTTYSGGDKSIDLPPGNASQILVSESASQTLTNKTLTSPAITTPTGIVKGDVGLGNVDNTSDATKNSATATLLNKTTVSSTALATGALTLPAGTTAEQPGTPVTGMVRYNSTTVSFEGYNNGAWSSIGGGGTTDQITYVAHPFAVGDVLYLNGTTYTKAIATSAAASEVVGVVSRVISADIFEITLSGEITGLSGLTAGEAYFLSPTTPGLLTTTEPTVLGQVSVPIGVASGTTTLYVAPKRGVVVGGTNARTEVALSNNATVTVQDVSPYQAGELTGWVEIDAGTDYKFYFSAPFAKNSAGSDYNISPSYVGETPPAGFSITVTAAGLVQATLPNLGSFVSSKVNFALNAPAVGATFPLTIDSTSVQFNTVKAKDSGGIVFQENGGTQIGSVSDTGEWELGDPANTSFPGNLIVGRKDGSVVPAGYVGQRISLACNWATTTLTANTDVQINNISSTTLEAGHYFIRVKGQTDTTNASTRDIEWNLIAGSTAAGGTVIGGQQQAPSGRDSSLITPWIYYACQGLTGNVSGTGQFSLGIRSNGATNTLYAAATVGSLEAIRIA
jgi:hypothetical protein